MKVPASELKVGDIIDGERRVVKVEKYLGAKLRVTFDYVSGSRKGERAAYVEKGDKLVSVEREACESVTKRMTRLLEAAKKTTSKKQRGIERRMMHRASSTGRGVECVKCGREMFNDNEYAERDEGPVCGTCGTEEGWW